MSTSNKCTKCGGTTWVLNEYGSYKRCDCYEVTKAKELWENYGVDPKEIKKINTYEGYNQDTKIAKKMAIDYVYNFSLKDSTWLLLTGKHGGGKTHLSIGIGAALLDKGIPVVYMPYIESMWELKANAMDNEYYLRIINRFKKSKVLIIDDLFKDKVANGKLIAGITDTDIKHFYPVLNYRILNNLQTIISTECTPEMLISLDEALAGRMIYSCKKNIVKFSEECDYRLKEYECGD